MPAIRLRDGPSHAVRFLERSDLEGVARLFHQRFRSADGEPGASEIAATAGYMERLYLQGPSGEACDGSLVQVDRQGGISGFLGLVKTRYRLGGERLSTCIVGALMAAEGAQHGAPGLRLLRALNEQSFELQLTDSANRLSLALALPMRFRLLPLDCLQWMRAFRPVTMLLDRMSRRWPRQPFELARPLAAGADMVIGRAFARSLDQRARRFQAEAIDADAFAELAPSFLGEFPLRPDWPSDELRWLLRHAAEQRVNGPLHFVRVNDADGASVGCFAFYGQAGGVALVLQVLANRSGWQPVLEHLMATAAQMGCCGITGQAQKLLMPHLFRYPGLIFRYAGGTMARSARADVMMAVGDSDILAGGLAGDRWTRLSAGDLGQSAGRLGFLVNRGADA
jgi:hypothetical protein